MQAVEPSAFELQSGSTKKEMQDLKGKAETQSDKIFELENKIKQLETSLDGLKSTYEGQQATTNELRNKVNSFDETNDLKPKIETNEKNIKTLTDSLQNLNESIAEIKVLLDDLKSSDKTPQKDSKESLSESFKNARKMTYAKNFDEAIAEYNRFIKLNYKKAESHYMLGNIAYEQNRYDDAIVSYKTSATLDDKASYMPRLLLNTANSFRVTNDTQNARRFYNSLIELFADTNEAKDAKIQLEKLK